MVTDDELLEDDSTDEEKEDETLLEEDEMEEDEGEEEMLELKEDEEVIEEIELDDATICSPVNATVSTRKFSPEALAFTRKRKRNVVSSNAIGKAKADWVDQELSMERLWSFRLVHPPFVLQLPPVRTSTMPSSSLSAAESPRQ